MSPEKQGPEVSRAEFSELESDGTGRGAPWLRRDLELVKDVKIGISAVLGRCELSVGDLFALKQGGTLTLDQPVDAAVDVTVEGKIVARGEIVVVGDRFGIRILELPDVA